ncbi:methionine synthase [Lonsdalea populi]|uniref:5-methyltetrahydropteroyltriglutamate-- homocysteine S-methyltransferase n=1 Tax=Lonsdalea TaxID=1082702 RepID=UPI000DCA8042|nr:MULTISPECIES: 5-methyltetrahydropteroyltriglutamate--homocysteine S-methyltransferase [Lonsdalea]RAT14370.1 methionine synthase [Lonsdalea quercina]RAT29046.1 methionine synthase [Lonsdalea populi]RAT36830.1 methionine synthase [Lonsdalea populi]RAT41804.1 methionine synthase [Lonsdalea populi]RAT49581.1 methionine synthase [Lonsdalea populi]
MSRTTHTLFPPFHAEHLGSLVCPPRLRQARQDWEQGRLSHDALAKIEDEEIMHAIDQQKACGLRVLTDGELRCVCRKTDFFTHFSGIERLSEPSAGRKKGAIGMKIVGEIEFDASHPFLSHFRFLHQAISRESELLAKQTLPSPTMLLCPSLRNNACYPSLEAYGSALSHAYRQVIRAFYEAGCRYLQFDDAMWASLSDRTVIAREQGMGNDPQYLLELYIRTLNQAIADKPEDMFISLHLCRGGFSGNWRYGDDFNAMTYAMTHALVDCLMVEYDDRRPAELELLRHITHQKVVLGIVSSRQAELEDPSRVMMAVNTASLYVPLRRLALSPTCGFASGNGDAVLSEAEQWSKLKHVVDIAKAAWKIPD